MSTKTILPHYHKNESSHGLFYEILNTVFTLRFKLSVGGGSIWGQFLSYYIENFNSCFKPKLRLEMRFRNFGYSVFIAFGMQ